MISLEKEPKELFKEFRCYELCIFCKKQTDTWNKQLNKPICVQCAKSKTVEDILKN